ncbi:MAG: toxin-antitoxin system YwqK family antitoxin [Planctomycetota bacterium]|nr:toxin-antitoxin system YwqK family antitoxin [Planctomycetota bacterium]
MMRKHSAPFLLAFLAGCQGQPNTTPEVDQASVSPNLPLAGLTVQASEPAPDSQDPVPVVKSPDPDGWESIESIEGQPVETVRRYYDSGRIRRIHTQLVGVDGPMGHHGRDLFLHENGAWSQESFWVNGKLQGSYKEWFEGGQLKVDSAFEGGKRHGTFKEYGGRGALRVQGEYTAGKLHGTFQQWFGTGDPQELSHWENGIQTGIRKVWDRENTPIVSESFVEGKRHGESTVYHRYPGELRIHQIGNYRRGSKEGVWMEFLPEGDKVQEKFFVNGKVTGYYKEWRDGVLTLETNYVDSVENGERLEYFADGKRFSKGIMKDAGREGVWYYWKEDGSIQTKWSGVYRDGNKVAELSEKQIEEAANHE